MNMNLRMALAITVAVVSALAGGAGQLDPVIGPQAAKVVVSLCNLLNTILASISAILSTQASQATSVAQNPAVLAQALQQTPGISGIQVNGNATPELAKLAVDQNQNKIGPAPGQERAVVNTAQQQ